MSASIVTETQRTRPTVVRWVVIVLVTLLVAAIAGNLVQSRAQATRVTPQNAAIEDALGVRFSRVAVVGDGGLITVSYVVLDAEKAVRFQADAAHAPVLQSEARDRSTRRVSLMKHGHNVRAGQTYYLVYQNSAGALRPQEEVSIDVGNLHLRHFPVL